MMSGQLTDMVNYFAETDIPNFGKYNDWSPNIFVQDAWMEINPAPEFQLDVGMLLLPFSHQGMQGATSLNAVDYHTKLIKYPAQKVWRDIGVMIRGLLFENVLEYRLAITDGVQPNTTSKTMGTGDEAYKMPTDPRNPKSWPRLTMRLTLNAFDPEGGATVAGFFYKGANLKETPDGIVSSKKVLAIGGSIDWQRGVNVLMKADDDGNLSVDDSKDYFAANADIFADIPLSADKLLALTGQVDFYFYDNGNRNKALFYKATDNKDLAGLYSGIGIASELGVRYSALEPIICFDWFNSTQMAKGDAGKIGDYMAIYGGVNYFWMAHNVTFKLEFGGQKEPRAKAAGIANGVVDKFAPFGTVQAQLVL